VGTAFASNRTVATTATADAHAAGSRAHGRDAGLKGSGKIRQTFKEQSFSLSSKILHLYVASQDVVIASQVQEAE
jgi:hypothetical protein